MRILYDFFIFIYRLAIHLAALRSPKARSFVEGRKNWRKKLNVEIELSTNNIWVHVASLGEFEQSLPVLDKINKFYPNYNIVLTFFSPSGYENAKIPEYIWYVYYLPLDTASNARYFLDNVKPKLILFVKYDIWYHYLNEAKKRGIKTILFSSLFRKDQIYFRFYGSLMRKALKAFDKIYVQNSNSKKILKSIGLNAEISGDTRFDRVKYRMRKNRIHPTIAKFARAERILVLGSTWQDDLNVILDTVNQIEDFKIIIAPHNIGKEEIEVTRKNIRLKSILFSDTNERMDLKDYRVLIIDNIGMLASVYAMGKLAYVGGAFHGSLHNILEPAVFGIPIIFGPNYKKFPEAQAMIDAGAAFSIHDKEGFEKTLKILSNEDYRIKCGKNAYQYISGNLGASNKVLDGIKSILENG